VLAADLLSENTELAPKTMGQPTLDFIETYLLCLSSKEEAEPMFDQICKVTEESFVI
jgi:hypothetical protein